MEHSPKAAANDLDFAIVIEQGDTGRSHRHVSVEAAVAEAERLSKNNQGKRFIVLRPVSYVEGEVKLYKKQIKFPKKLKVEMKEDKVEIEEDKNGGLISTALYKTPNENWHRKLPIDLCPKYINPDEWHGITNKNQHDIIDNDCLISYPRYPDGMPMDIQVLVRMSKADQLLEVWLYEQEKKLQELANRGA